MYVFDLFELTSTEKIKELIESRSMLIMHNANFDMQFLFFMGIDFKGKIFDTFIAERVLNAGQKIRKYGPKSQKVYFDDISCSLKNVAQRRLGLEVDKTQQTSDWSKPELDMEQVKYAAEDVLILPEIYKQQLDELKEEDLITIYSLESKCIRPVAKMCAKGFGVDRGKLLKLKEEITADLQALTRSFVELLDSRLPEDSKLPREKGVIRTGKNPKKDFNPGSVTQLIKAFNLAKVATPKTDEGKQTLNQVALAEFDSDDPVMLLYRKRAKTETKLEHVNKLLDNIHPLTHRIHSGYNQMGANSGRFTSSGARRQTANKEKTVFAINIQQVPRSKDFRSCFIPAPGNKLIICDWAQIELRLGAELINVPQMRKAFNEGVDLHSLTASLVHGKPIDEVSKDERQEGKTLNFALLYGMGYRKYKTYAAQSGKIISLSQAKVAHGGFHRAYPQIKTWHWQRASIVEDGPAYVRTSVGRRRLLSNDDATMMCSSNTLIQGTGADILKIAIAKIGEHLDDSAHLIACIHDELVLEVDEGRAEYFRGLLEKTMVEAAEVVLKNVPAEADAFIGSSWADKG